MNRIIVFLIVVLGATACAKEPRTTAELARQGPDGIAIDGYSPVSYFTKQKAEKGSPEFSVEYDGLTYWLSDESQMQLFGADPSRYVPAHRGWCSLMLTGSGNLAVANPESFKIVDDRLLLFWSGEFKGQSINGLGNWESKFENSKKELQLVDEADKTWQKLLSGGKKEKVVFFSPLDLERVNEDRRASGNKMYD